MLTNPEKMPVSYELMNKWDAWIKAGALASEMETAALYIASSTLRMKAATVLVSIWNQEREKRGMDNNTNFRAVEHVKAMEQEFILDQEPIEDPLATEILCEVQSAIMKKSIRREIENETD